MSDTSCSFCKKPNPMEFCEACYAALCKACVQRVFPEQFEYLGKTPESITHEKFCHHCYEKTVEPELENYNQLLEKAREVHYWPKSYHGFIPVLNKSNQIVEVKDAADAKDALFKLGLEAAKLGFNSLVLGQIKYKKIRDHGYQKMLWDGTARPANVDLEKVERNEFREELYE